MKKIYVWLAVVAVAVATAFAVATPAPAVNKNIGNAELVRLQSTGAWVVDVRTQGEYAAGHIAEAANVPIDQIQRAASTWSKDQAIIVYCSTGARSANAAAYLAGQGFKKVYNLEKGIADWSGQLVAGQNVGPTPSGPSTVKTSGKPLFIDFASST